MDVVRHRSLYNRPFEKNNTGTTSISNHRVEDLKTNMPAADPFTHILLTRFNTSVGFAPSQNGLDRNWLEARLILFERYCLPSVATQVCSNFKWLVFCDEDSPKWFKERMAAYGELLLPVYIAGPATDHVIARSVVTSGIVSSQYLITTRLDNDDAIGADHLRLVQQAFMRQIRTFLVFPFGLQLYRGQLFNTYWQSNPFLSLIEKVSTEGLFTTVMCVEHNLVRTAGEVQCIFSVPQWLQVIHGANLQNSLRGWPRLSRREPSAFRILSLKEVSDSMLTRLCFSTKALIARGIRIQKRLAATIRRRCGL